MLTRWPDRLGIVAGHVGSPRMQCQCPRPRHYTLQPAPRFCPHVFRLSAPCCLFFLCLILIWPPSRLLYPCAYLMLFMLVASRRECTGLMCRRQCSPQMRSFALGRTSSAVSSLPPLYEHCTAWPLGGAAPLGLGPRRTPRCRQRGKVFATEQLVSQGEGLVVFKCSSACLSGSSFHPGRREEPTAPPHRGT